MNLLDFPGCILPISIILFIIFCKYRGYLKRKEKAYRFKYGQKAFNELKKWKKSKIKDKNNLPEYVINYNSLTKKQIKDLLKQRCFALMFKYEYGNKEYNLYKHYKNNTLENLTETDIKRLEKKIKEMNDLIKYDRDTLEIERYISVDEP